MKKLLSLGLALSLFFVLAGTAMAVFLWKGIDWGVYAGAGLAVNTDGNLEVTPVGSNYGAAHYNTSLAYRNAAAPCLEVKFVDQGVGGPQTQLWVEKEGGPGAAWFQFGTWQGSNQYQIYWWNVDTNAAGWQDVGARSDGEHLLKVGKRANGVIDYLLDGQVVWSTTNIAPAYFGDVYLASKFGTSEFTDYSTCTDYQYPVSGVITDPAANGDQVVKTLNLAATYDDGDTANDDAVQWAVRKGTCASGTNTVLGNVDGHHDVATWDGKDFNFSADIRDAAIFVPGEYCFVFNPTDDTGQPDIRETRTFFIDAYLPVSKDECKNDGWQGFVTPAFKNQGDCVSFLQSNENAVGNKDK